MQQSSNFTSATTANGGVNPNWDFTNTWVQYNGHTDPLLRSFMTALTVTAGAASKTYDGTVYSGGLSSPSYSVAGAASSGHLFGLSKAYGANAINAGTYASDLYSDQQGYIIDQSGVGALTINPAPLTLTGITASNKVYDGTTAATLNTAGVGYSGLIGTDTVTLGGAGVGTFSDNRWQACGAPRSANSRSR